MKLVLEKVNYSYKDLGPIMSEDTLKYHRDNLAKSYIKRFNAGEGDSDFNEAGAFLHNLFFPQFKKPGGQNKPTGACKEFINENFESFDFFKEEFASTAMSIQGSGWVYLARDGKIKTIKNHQIKNDIILLVDWWEHAWALDYQSDKRAYLKNIWKIIDWNVVSERLNLIKKSRFNKLQRLSKIASKKKTYADKEELPHLKIARLYHRTSKEAADKIYKTKRFTSKINTSFGTEIYFSNKPSGAISGYGLSLVAVDIPEKYIHIDDEFPDGEKHYRVSSADLYRFGRLVPRNELPDREGVDDIRRDQLSLFSSLATRELKIAKFSSGYARNLGDVLTIKEDFPNADFWIWRTHNPGKTTKEYHPKAIGVSIRDEFRDQLDPKYLYYIFQYYEMMGFWKQFEAGTVIPFIRISEIKKLPIAFLSPGA